jgi:peptidoglycan/LPS O-acetylase OafA/YrhL
MDSSPTPATTAGRVPELDGIRGLAILGVLLWHCVVHPLDPGANEMLAQLRHGLSLTGRGVDLFFVLSGYLIGGILIDHRRDARYFGTFYLRRACRILPAYVALLALVAVGFVVFARWQPAPPWLGLAPIPWWSYLLFVQNAFMAHANDFGTPWLSATWSLAVEEQFYLVLPALVWWVSPRRLQWWCLGAALFAPAVLLTFGDDGTLAGYVSLASRCDSLMVGVGIAWLFRRAGTRAWLVTHRRTLYVALLGLGLVASWLNLAVQPGHWFFALRYQVLALCCGLLLALALGHSRGPIAAICRLRPLRFLGVVAYGAYLVHQPVQHLLHWSLRQQMPRLAGPEDAVVALLALAFTLGVAHLSWRYLESPFVALGHRARYGDAALGEPGARVPTEEAPRPVFVEARPVGDERTDAAASLDQADSGGSDPEADRLRSLQSTA